jgi:nitrogen fixation protein FixH
MTMPAKRSPWVVGLLVGFAVVVVVNMVFIWIASKGADPIAASYRLEAR